MTRKDYEAIAAALKLSRPNDYSDPETVGAQRGRLMIVAENIADVMARDNPRFDRGRFLKAAGVAQ